MRSETLVVLHCSIIALDGTLEKLEERADEESALTAGDLSNQLSALNELDTKFLRDLAAWDSAFEKQKWKFLCQKQIKALVLEREKLSKKILKVSVKVVKGRERFKGEYTLGSNSLPIS